MAIECEEIKETGEQVVARMNETLVGQHGIVITKEKKMPKYVGTFVQVEMDKYKALVRFTDELVQIFPTATGINVVSKKKDSGGYLLKVACEELYIGDKTFYEIADNKVEVPKNLLAKLSVRDLIQKTGTFTGCKELTDKFVADGLIHKEGRTLHVSMGISNEPGCICGIAYFVHELESLTRDLLKHFDSDEIVYHHTYLTKERTSVVEVEPGHEGLIQSLPGAHVGDRWCGTYPVIKGINMRWEFVPTD